MPSFSKVFAIRKKSPQTKFAPAGTAAADWLANAIQLVKGVQTASDLVPFPYIKSAAGTLLVFLEPIQQLQKNREDYKGLVQTTVEIIRLLQEEVLASPDVAAGSDRFKQQCEDVDSCLRTIVNDLNEITARSSTFFKQYWSSRTTCDLIAKYQNEVNQLRSNLILRNTVATRGQVEKTLHMLQKRSIIFSELNDAAEDVDISEFRHYKLGELELLERHVIEINNIEYEQHYSIKLQDTIGEKTARIYRGKEGLKRWRSDISILSKLRHPHIAQVFGISISRDSAAMIMHNHAVHDPFEFYSQLQPIDKVIFSYNLIKDYQSAVDYIGPKLDDKLLLSSSYAFNRVCSDIWLKMKDGTVICFKTFTDINGHVTISINVGLTPIYTEYMKPTVIASHTPFGSYWFTSLMPKRSKLSHQRLSDTVSRALGGLSNQSYKPQNIIDIKTDLESLHDMLLPLISLKTHTVIRKLYQIGEIWEEHGSRGPSAVARMPFVLGSGSFVTKEIVYQEVIRPGWLRLSPPPRGDWGGPQTVMILECLDIKKLYTQWFAETPRILACSASIIKPDIRLAVVIGIKLSIGAPTLQILESEELNSKYPTPHLFVSIPKIDSKGVVSAPQAYWSMNIDGLIPMSQNDMICYGINQPELFLQPELASLDNAYVQTLVELHRRCGFAQDSLQASKLLRTPPLQLVNPMTLKERKRVYNLESEPVEAENLDSFEYIYGIEDPDNCLAFPQRCRKKHRRELAIGSIACYDLADHSGTLSRRYFDDTCTCWRNKV